MSARFKPKDDSPVPAEGWTWRRRRYGAINLNDGERRAAFFLSLLGPICHAAAIETAQERVWVVLYPNARASE